jgi:hypothetical protein
LDRVKNAALHLCLGAFRTSPISSLNVEASEPPLLLGRQKLALQYVIKLESCPSNPAYACVFRTNFSKLFEAKPNAVSTLGIRTREAVEESGVDLNCIAEYSIPTTPLGLLYTPGFNYTLYNTGAKSNTSPELYHSVYNQLTDVYQGYKKIFSDGSKQGAAVAAAAVTEGKVLVKRLPDNASIFSAESKSSVSPTTATI